MSLKQQMADDLKSVFYNTDDFAIAVLYKNVSITALHVEDLEISDTEQMVISCLELYVSDIQVGDEIIIDGITYKVINFDFKDKFKTEKIIALTKV